MAKDVFWIAVTFIVIILVLALTFWPSTNGNVVVVKYDCSLLTGDSRHDIPVKVQEQCRKRELYK